MNAFTEAKFAWEPVTPRGVAAFARASLERLIVVQSIVALIATSAIVWLLADGFFPTVEAAIRNLPAQGEISRGKLDWPDGPPKLLAEGRFVSFTVDPKHSQQLRLPAHFQFEFGTDSLVIISLLGQMEIPYPPDQSFYFNRTDLLPAWGAWAPNFLGLLAIGAFLGLLLTWAAMATVYFLVVWVVALYGDRALNFRAAWKLAGAALLPGALVLTAGIFCYGFGAFDLVQLGFTFTMHFIISWIYLFVSVMFLNRAVPEAKRNPFVEKV